MITEEETQALESIANTKNGQLLAQVLEKTAEDLEKLPVDQLDKTNEQVGEEVKSNYKAAQKFRKMSVWLKLVPNQTSSKSNLKL